MPALIDDLLNILLGGILLAYRTILLILALLVNSARPALTVSPAHMRADSPTATAQPLGLPNIVFILADDLDLDLDTVTTMPHLQALLAGQGITFTHFFVPAAWSVRTQPRRLHQRAAADRWFRDLP